MLKTYRDPAECPEGHKFVVPRRRTTAGKVVGTVCPVCHKTYIMQAGPLPKPEKPLEVPKFKDMHAMRESQIEKRLVKRVKELGGEVRKVKWIGRNGAPDRIVMLPWMEGDQSPPVIWVELKAPGKKAEPHQAREHERMRKMGQRVEVVDSFERIEEILK